MGCGCGKRNAARVTAAPATRKNIVGGGTPQGVTPKLVKNAACQEKYDELAMLDRKIVSIYKKFRFSQIGYRYAETQKVVRGWIAGLKEGCPDEDELKEYKDYINSEYAKYFNAAK